MTEELFSVYFESNESLGSIIERECHLVPFDIAKKWFRHHTTNVCANVGWTVRVMMTDAGDAIVAEWEFGKGIVWPTAEAMQDQYKP